MSNNFAEELFFLYGDDISKKEKEYSKSFPYLNTSYNNLPTLNKDEDFNSRINFSENEIVYLFHL